MTPTAAIAPLAENTREMFMRFNVAEVAGGGYSKDAATKILVDEMEEVPAELYLVLSAPDVIVMRAVVINDDQNWDAVQRLLDATEEIPASYFLYDDEACTDRII